jgi:hypothetical protein
MKDDQVEQNVLYSKRFNRLMLRLVLPISRNYAHKQRLLLIINYSHCQRCSRQDSEKINGVQIIERVTQRVRDCLVISTSVDDRSSRYETLIIEQRHASHHAVNFYLINL